MRNFLRATPAVPTLGSSVACGMAVYRKLRCDFPDDAATAAKAVVRTSKSRFAIQIAVRVQHRSS